MDLMPKSSDILDDIARAYLSAKIQKLHILNQNGANMVYLHGQDMANKLNFDSNQRMGITPFPSPVSNVSITGMPVDYQQPQTYQPPPVPQPPIVVPPEPTVTAPPVSRPVTPQWVPPAPPAPASPLSTKTLIAAMLASAALGGGGTLLGGYATGLIGKDKSQPPAAVAPIDFSGGEVGLDVE